MRNAKASPFGRGVCAADGEGKPAGGSRSGFPSYNLSVSLRSTAPLVGEPLAKPFTLRGLPRPPLARGGGSASALTERLSPAAALTQAACPLSRACARQGRVAAPSVCFGPWCGPRILLAAAPTAPPCFRRWRRSSPLPPEGEPLACRSGFVWTSKAQYLGNGSAPLSRPAAA